MMAETKEEKILAACGHSNLSWGFLTKERKEKAIRQRIDKLLDELHLFYNHNRSPYNDKVSNMISISGLLKVKRSVQFSDSELPEKEQDLLLWLADKLAERKEK